MCKDCIHELVNGSRIPPTASDDVIVAFVEEGMDGRQGHGWLYRDCTEVCLRALMIRKGTGMDCATR